MPSGHSLNHYIYTANQKKERKSQVFHVLQHLKYRKNRYFIFFFLLKPSIKYNLHKFSRPRVEDVSFPGQLLDIHLIRYTYI